MFTMVLQWKLIPWNMSSYYQDDIPYILGVQVVEWSTPFTTTNIFRSTVYLPQGITNPYEWRPQKGILLFGKKKKNFLATIPKPHPKL